MKARPTFDRLISLFGHGRRGVARYTVFFSGTVVTVDGTATVTIRDLSTMGAQVQGRQLPPPGSVLILKRGRLERAARVAWCSGDRSGLAFETPISGEALRKLIEGGASSVRDPVAVLAA